MLDIGNFSPNVKSAVRTVDARSPLNKKLPKAARACDAADLLDGLAVLLPTLRLAAKVSEISVSSVTRARRLTPEQHDAVRRGERPRKNSSVRSWTRSVSTEFRTFFGRSK